MQGKAVQWNCNHLWRVFKWHSKLLQVTAKLFDPLQVGVLHRFGQEPQFPSNLLHLGHLTRPAEKKIITCVECKPYRDSVASNLPDACLLLVTDEL